MAKGEETRQALIEAGTRIFAERGFDGASVKDLADAAGVNVSLISYYFKGKEGLFQACLEEFGSTGLDSAERALKTPQSRVEFVTRFQVFVEEFLTANLRDEHIFRLVHRELASSNISAVNLILARLISVVRRLEEFLRAAQAAGIARQDLDPATSARIIFGGLMNMIHMHHARHWVGSKSLLNSKTIDKTVGHFVRQSTGGVLAGEDV